MIRVSDLMKILQTYPPDAKVSAYEGEGIGLRIEHGDKFAWISASPDEDDDVQYPDDLELS